MDGPAHEQDLDLAEQSRYYIRRIITENLYYHIQSVIAVRARLVGQIHRVGCPGMYSSLVFRCSAR